jgi:hypothetical protein
MFMTWVIGKLKALKEERILIVQDSLRLLPENDGTVHRFASENGFTVIVASTNLVFRELFERAMESKETDKILVIDRAPARRRTSVSLMKAPPPFYPDLLSRTTETARINIGLRQFLIEKTGDTSWPQEANESRFARLVIGSIDAILKAHKNLRAADSVRFTDHDFKTIVAYASLGVPEAAFTGRQDPQNYWRIAFWGHGTLDELDSLAPDIAETVRSALRAAPAPFCWFADFSPEVVIRSFYLSVILSQHTENWRLLTDHIDPDFKPQVDIDLKSLQDSAHTLSCLDPQRARQDITDAENSLSKETLGDLFLEHFDIRNKGQFVTIIEKEHYSMLIRSLALLLALHFLAADKLSPEHKKLVKILDEPENEKGLFIEQFSTPEWKNLKETYHLLYVVLELQKTLEAALKEMNVKLPSEGLSFEWFWTVWNEGRVNRLEYYMSDLTRMAQNASLVPRSVGDLPSFFGKALEKFKASIEGLYKTVQQSLDRLNSGYQELVSARYKTWVASDSPEVYLTSQCVRRCLKPYWDAQKEKAVLFVFDGMRYDIWDELVRPVFEDRMEILMDYHASSLLPSETHVSRKAIFAGKTPDSFDSRAAENGLLKTTLQKEFGYTGEVDVVNPEGMGTGETVRYRAGNLDCFIFELCDKELHKIQMKTLADGRNVPSRPLTFIYKSHIKDIIDTEVTTIVRGLAPNTKVFVVADHGFGLIGRRRVEIDQTWLNEPDDCRYLNAELKYTLRESYAPDTVRDDVWEFSVADLKMPGFVDKFDKKTKENWKKYYKSIIFPKTGCSFSRPKAKYSPDAYSHGGISIQEMFIPMLAMKVKAPEDNTFVLGDIVGPKDLIEGESAEFRIPVHFAGSEEGREIRLEVQTEYRNNRDETPELPAKVQYLPSTGGDIVFGFIPDVSDASDKERVSGVMERELKFAVVYSDKKRAVRQARAIRFAVRLNSEKIVRRIPANLGKILGLAPKDMR